MKSVFLNGSWVMECPDGHMISGRIPGSVYSFLLKSGEMEDPYFRDHELSALELMNRDYTFHCQFDVPPDILACSHRILRFEGIDTLGDLYLNGHFIAHVNNMHITWEFEVGKWLQPCDNRLTVCLHSPTGYIREQDALYHIGGSYDSMRGFPHLRKAHCMFGWDWGPRLPDQGIWRNVSLCGWNEVRITDIHVRQRHLLPDGRNILTAPDGGAAARKGDLQVFLTIDVQLSETTQAVPADVSVLLSGPDGEEMEVIPGIPFEVPQPKLWWPNGLGNQPLYTATVSLTAHLPNGQTDQETKKLRIGLRTAAIFQEKDKWGESFAAMVNGRTFFSMGADYIPEDNILSRCSRERTAQLIQVCKDSHFNAIRVWGGGYYPDDSFYDLCDEAGLLVWQDLMFACANYRLTPDFVKSIQTEITQNVRRIRHHACLGLWCGNNEMEQFALEREYEGTDETAADYLIQNQYIIPEILRKEDPDTFYWPSSPSSGGNFDNPRDENRGDVHYWEVWHGNQPFTAYRDFYFRYLSEFGFQSFPCMETIRSFTLPEDRNIFSYVMEMHQRNSGANGKILAYLSQTYLFPSRLEDFVYASQLLQADAIRYGVEHFRRNRADNRCMGAIYWQLNDIWPVASWASIDYFGRWKALQYAARRFFAPVLLSCEEENLQSKGYTCITEPGVRHFSARLCVSNESWDEVSDTVIWELRDPEGQVLRSGKNKIKVSPFDVCWLEKISFDEIDPRSAHLYYELQSGRSDGSVLFVPPKHYRFADPHLRLVENPEEELVTIYADAYARSVEIYTEDGNLLLEDNFFDMEPGSRKIRILRRTETELKVRSVYDLGRQLNGK